MLGQFPELLWDAAGIRENSCGIADCGPPKLLSDGVDRPICTPSSRTGLGARAAFCMFPTGAER
jgi:hypothetical protein